MITRRELRLFIEYYKGIVLINAPLSLLLLLFRFDLVRILIFYCTLGFVLALGYLKLFRNDDYIFYHNCGLTKTQLIVAASGINIIAVLFIYFTVVWFTN
ncbi:hypothetical protein [Flavobacterium sp. JP2137]|uniref:hypothetical protein n=1 Tax=Flavobacterium sp. JP2137 TaxID=3414510 RepID=UPI003D2FEA84